MGFLLLKLLNQKQCQNPIPRSNLGILQAQDRTSRPVRPRASVLDGEVVDLGTPRLQVDLEIMIRAHWVLGLANLIADKATPAVMTYPDPWAVVK